ncbi:MAG: TIGR04219 family outer membrane beta-barrel protein [Cellvibrionales bacterium]|nr:TIGR04219 family outer membrane beta-barrel protein [Cellvibrionales bacterium]
MKKPWIVTLGLLANVSQADILFTAEVGASMWQVEASGSVDDADLGEEGMNLDTSGKMNVYASFEHPLPILPNIKVANTNLTLEGTNDKVNFDFDGTSFEGKAKADVDLSHTDLTLYWGLPLPVPYLDINVGLTGRQFDGFVEVQGDAEVNGQIQTETEIVEFNQVLPMGYLGVKLGDFFGVYAYADLNYVGYDDNSFSDFTAALGYELPVPIIGISFEGGYRQMKLKTDIDDFVSDVELSGPFGGINFSLGF